MKLIGKFTRRSPLLFIIAPFGALMVLVLAIDPEPQLKEKLERATALSPSKSIPSDLTLNFQLSNDVTPTTAPEARSEAFWLSRSPNTVNTASVNWNAPLVPGDFIFLNYGSNEGRKLEVVSVQEEHERTTKIDTNFISKPIYVLICKDILTNDQTLIKLSIDALGSTVAVVETVS